MKDVLKFNEKEFFFNILGTKKKKFKFRDKKQTSCKLYEWKQYFCLSILVNLW